jgi:hypothetical protein
LAVDFLVLSGKPTNPSAFERAGFRMLPLKAIEDCT